MFDVHIHVLIHHVHCCVQAIEKDYRNKSGVCFTELLEQWLIRSTPAPTLQALIDVLKSPVIDLGDSAQDLIEICETVTV